MKLTTKHFFVLISLSLLLTITVGLLSFLYHSPYFFKVPKHTVLINRLREEQRLPIRLYYSTPNQSHIRVYTLDDEQISLLPIAFSSYTEGFLPRQAHTALLKKIQTHLPQNPPLSYFYNYYQDTDYEIVAPTGPLSQIYFINRKTDAVTQPDTRGIIEKNFYLNHIVRNNNVYYLLGDLVGEYKGVFYTLDATTLKVQQTIQFETSDLTVYKQHSTLNSDGDIFFITKGGVKYINRGHTKATFISLDFTPSYIISSAHETIAFNLLASSLHYAVLDLDGKVIHQGTLPLPEEGLLPVKGTFKGQHLTLLTFSPGHPFYTNYVLIYDLASKTLTYCCALQDLSPYMALDLSLTN